MCAPKPTKLTGLTGRGLLPIVALALAVCSLAALPVAARADGGNVEITAALIHAGQGREDRSYEWVLITNLGDEAAELSGWTLSDNSSADELQEQRLDAGASLLIVAACSALIGGPVSDRDEVLEDSAIGGGLANAGDLLELRDDEGVLVDAVSWGNDATHGERRPPEAGTPLRFGRAPIPAPRPTADPVRLGVRVAGFDAVGDFATVEVVNACEWAQPLAGWLLTHGQMRLDLSKLTAPPSGAVPIQVDGLSAGATVRLHSPDGRVVDTAVGLAPDAPANEAKIGVDDAPSETAPESVLAASMPRIRISEFMPRPLSGEPEWVELINDGTEAVDLSGWKIGDSHANRPLWGAIEPGARVVFSDGPLADANGEVRLLEGRIGNGLNNDGDRLALIGPDGAVVAAIEYGGPALPTPAAGSSLALTPQVWVVNVAPSPGGSSVSPALEASNVSVEVVERSPAPVAPIAELQAESGINPWMIVSAGLGGLLIALVLRRWLPNQREDDGAALDEPPLPEDAPPDMFDSRVDYPLPDDGAPAAQGRAVAEESPPYDAGPARRHPWNGEDE